MCMLRVRWVLFIVLCTLRQIRPSARQRISQKPQETYPAELGREAVPSLVIEMFFERRLTSTLHVRIGNPGRHPFALSHLPLTQTNLSYKWLLSVSTVSTVAYL